VLIVISEAQDSNTYY